MKASKWLWYVLGGLGLVALGCLIGFGLRSTSIGWGIMPMMGTWNGHMVGWRTPGLFLGLRWLIIPIFWLGPIAGIVALILVLTRRNTSTTTPPVVEAPKTEETKTG